MIFSDPDSRDSEAGWLSDSYPIGVSVIPLLVYMWVIYQRGYPYHYYFSPRCGFYENDTVTYPMSIRFRYAIYFNPLDKSGYIQGSGSCRLSEYTSFGNRMGFY